MTFWKYAGRAALAAIALQTLAIPSRAQETQMQGYYGLELRAGAEAHALAIVNGVPAAERFPGDAGVSSMAIQALVQPGENTLLVLVGTEGTPPLGPRAIVAEAGVNLTATAIVQLTVLPPDGDMRAAKTENLATQTFDGAAALAEALARGEPGLALPVRLSIRWQAPADHPVTPWAAATPVTAAQITGPALARLAQLRDMLAAGDVAGFVAGSALKYRHAAAAFPLLGGYDRVMAQDAAELREIVATPGFAMAPIDPDATCRLYAGGRLVECFAPDGGSALRGAAPGEAPIELGVMFSVLDGVLRVVR